MPHRWQFDDYAISALKRVAVDPPPLGESDVRVAVRALSLNYRDLMVLEGWLSRNLQLPTVPLSDCSGEVVEVGAGVTEFAVGDPVVSHYVADWQDGDFLDEYLGSTLGVPGPGVAATELVLPAAALVARPPSLDHAEGATLPIAALTAWSSLQAGDPVGPGSTVLALGTGGVSVVGLQMAKLMGARTIITSKDDDKLAIVAELGIDHGVNYRQKPEWSQQVRDLTDGRGVDLVLEAGGALTLNESLRSLRAGGTAALFGVLTGSAGEIGTRQILARRLNVRGIYVDSRSEFKRMNEFIQQVGYKPFIGQRFGFDELPLAFESMKGQSHIGKIVATV